MVGAMVQRIAVNQAWMWKRAPVYFDVVAYSSFNSSTVSHNLGAVPE